MLTKKQIKQLKDGGSDYAGDAICWDEKFIAEARAAGKSPREIRGEAPNLHMLEDCAFDLARCSVESGEKGWKGVNVSAAADYVWEGMIEKLKEKGLW